MSFSTSTKWSGVLTHQFTVWVICVVCLVVSSVMLGRAISNPDGGFGAQKETGSATNNDNDETRGFEEDFAFQVFLSQAFMHFLSCYFALIGVLRTDRTLSSWWKARLARVEPARVGFYACISISVCTGIITPIIYATAPVTDREQVATCLSFISLVLSALATGLLAMKILDA